MAGKRKAKKGSTGAATTSSSAPKTSSQKTSPSKPKAPEPKAEEFETIGSRIRREKSKKRGFPVEDTAEDESPPAKKSRRTSQEEKDSSPTQTAKIKQPTKNTNGSQANATKPLPAKPKTTKAQPSKPVPATASQPPPRKSLPRGTKRKSTENNQDEKEHRQQNKQVNKPEEKSWAEKLPGLAGPHSVPLEESELSINKIMRRSITHTSANEGRAESLEAAVEDMGDFKLESEVDVVNRVIDFCAVVEHLSAEHDNNPDTRGRPTMSASLELKKQALPLLDELSVQILSIFAFRELDEIEKIVNKEKSEGAKAYTGLRKLFDYTKRLYATRNGLIQTSELALLGQNAVTIGKKANFATYVGSCFGSGDVSFFHLDGAFLETFVSDGYRILKQQASLWLSIKTQAVISARMMEADLTEVVEDMFPPDLEERLKARYQENKPLPTSDAELVKESRSRYWEMLAGAITHMSLAKLRQRYTWDGFLMELSHYFNKNFQSIAGGPQVSLKPFHRGGFNLELTTRDQSKDKTSEDVEMKFPEPVPEPEQEQEYQPDLGPEMEPTTTSSMPGPAVDDNQSSLRRSTRERRPTERADAYARPTNPREETPDSLLQNSPVSNHQGHTSHGTPQQDMSRLPQVEGPKEGALPPISHHHPPQQALNNHYPPPHQAPNNHQYLPPPGFIHHSPYPPPHSYAVGPPGYYHGPYGGHPPPPPHWYHGHHGPPGPYYQPPHYAHFDHANGYPAPYFQQNGPPAPSPYGVPPDAPYLHQHHPSYQSPFSTQPEPVSQQSAPTAALYEEARAIASQKTSSTSRNKANTVSQRRAWTPEEERALMEGIDQVKGPHWSSILALWGEGGTQGDILKGRTQVQLKDKARNLKLFFLKSNIEVPYYLQNVTGDLKRTSRTDGVDESVVVGYAEPKPAGSASVNAEATRSDARPFPPSPASTARPGLSYNPIQESSTQRNVPAPQTHPSQQGHLSAAPQNSQPLPPTHSIKAAPDSPHQTLPPPLPHAAPHPAAKSRLTTKPRPHHEERKDQGQADKESRTSSSMPLPRPLSSTAHSPRQTPVTSSVGVSGPPLAASASPTLAYLQPAQSTSAASPVTPSPGKTEFRFKHYRTSASGSKKSRGHAGSVGEGGKDGEAVVEKTEGAEEPTDESNDEIVLVGLNEESAGRRRVSGWAAVNS